MKYAPLYPRIMAFLLDTIIFLIPAFGIYYFGRSAQDSFTYTAQALLFLLGLLNFVYQISMHACFGQSLGKMWAKIEVVRIDGKAISWREATLRSLVLMIFFAIGTIRVLVGPSSLATFLSLVGKLSSPWFTAECISVLWRNDNRAIHDLIASTVVVQCAPCPKT